MRASGNVVQDRLAYGIVAAAALAGAQGAFADGGFASLQPGVPTAGLDESVKVNVVFVGLKPGQIDTAQFLSDLPQESRPIVRSRLYYGITEELGIDYTYDYSTTFTTPAWDASFFAALKGLSKPAPRTEYQDLYNEQAGTRDVGKNNAIDAPSVEKWLIDHAPPGVDTRRDTIFFVNWWGRPDFIDHVYTKIGEPDPDTGYDFGARARQPQARRVGRDDPGRRGDRARQARRQPRLVLRPLGRARGVGRQLRHHERRPRRRRGAGLPGSARLGVQRHGLPRAVGADRRPRAGGALHGDRPAVHVVTSLPAVPEPRRCCRTRSTSGSTPSRAGRTSMPRRRTRSPTTSSARSASSSPRWR